MYREKVLKMLENLPDDSHVWKIIYTVLIFRM